MAEVPHERFALTPRLHRTGGTSARPSQDGRAWCPFLDRCSPRCVNERDDKPKQLATAMSEKGAASTRSMAFAELPNNVA
jgi:hypothetical protein